MFDRGVAVKVSFSGTDKRVLSRAKQSFSKDADINNIMGRYRRTGVLVDPTTVNVYRRPNYGDFSDLVDLPVLLDRIREADRSFMVLPASVRERFDNDVSKLLDFVSDDKNVEEAVKLELLPDTTPAYVAIVKAKEEAAKAGAKAAATASAVS